MSTQLVRGLDFTTYYVRSLTADQSTQMVAAGMGHVMLGYDSAPSSVTVRNTLVSAGMSWSAYRFLYPTLPILPQIADVLQGIHQTPLPLPWWLVLDLEPYNGVMPTIAQIEQAADAVEAGDVTPLSLVRPAAYSAAWCWPAGYDGLARRGWGLVAANWNGQPDLAVPLFGGWSPEQLIGHQYTGNTQLAGIDVDLDVFLIPTPSPTSGPVQPDSALARIKRGMGLLDQARTEFDNADQDLEPGAGGGTT